MAILGMGGLAPIFTHPPLMALAVVLCLLVVASIRNPSYLGFIINTLGWGLAFRSGVGVILAALHVPPIIARIRAEEAVLHTQFGDEFDTYCAHTYRLLRQ